MTDMDELRDTLAAPPDFTPRALDLDAIISSGTRLRRRRRMTTVAAAVVALAAVTVGGAQVTGRLGAGPAEMPAGPQPSVVATTPAEKLTLELSENGSKPRGEFIDTGLKSNNAEIYIVGYTGPTQPDGAPFGFIIGERHGTVVEDSGDTIDASSAPGADSRPGFGSVLGPASNDDLGKVRPAFGFYIGSPSTITAKVNGLEVAAQHVRWSVNPQVTVFWFDPEEWPVDAEVQASSLTARDASGEKLPRGNPEMVQF